MSSLSSTSVTRAELSPWAGQAPRALRGAGEADGAAKIARLTAKASPEMRERRPDDISMVITLTRESRRPEHRPQKRQRFCA